MKKSGLFLFLIVILVVNFVSASSTFTIKVDNFEKQVEFVGTINHNSVEMSVGGKSKVFDSKQLAHPYSPVLTDELYFILKDVNPVSAYNDEMGAKFLIGLELFLCKENCNGDFVKTVNVNDEEHVIELLEVTGPEAVKIKSDNKIKVLNNLRVAPYYVTKIDDVFFAPVNISFPQYSNEEESVRLLVFFETKFEADGESGYDSGEIKINDTGKEVIESIEEVVEEIPIVEEIEDVQSSPEIEVNKEKTGFFRKIINFFKKIFS